MIDSWSIHGRLRAHSWLLHGWLMVEGRFRGHCGKIPGTPWELGIQFPISSGLETPGELGLQLLLSSGFGDTCRRFGGHLGNWESSS